MVTPVHAALSAVNVGKKFASGEEPSPAMAASAAIGWHAASSVGAKATQIKDANSITAEKVPSAEQPFVYEQKIVAQETNLDASGEGQKISIIEQSVADPRYADYGNLVDCWDKIKSGEIPESDDFIRAFIDVIDASTFGLFSQKLLSHKLEPHLQQRFVKHETDIDIQEWATENNAVLSKDVTYKEGVDGETISVETISREIEEEKGKTIVTFQTETTYEPGTTINVKDFSNDVSVNDINSELKDVNVTDINKSGIIKNVNIKTSYIKVEETGRETHVICNVDIGKFWGREQLYKVTKPATVIEKKDSYTYRIKNVEGLHNDLQSATVFNDTNTLEKIEEDHFETSREIKGVSDTTKNFEEGAIQYVPAIGNLGIILAKIDYGVNVTGMDVFWGAVDIAELATLGTLTLAKTGITAGVKTAAKASTKTVVKETAEQTAETTVKSLGKEGLEATTKKTIKEGAEKATSKTVNEVADVAQARVSKKIPHSEIDDTVMSAASNPKKMKSGLSDSSLKRPINSDYAGKTYPLEKLSTKLQKKYPDSVKFTADGYPDFSPYAKSEVKVKGLNGNYAHDSALANKTAGLDRTPNGYVWHHHQDCKKMQLVPQDIHSPRLGGIAHSGGASILKQKQLIKGV